MKLSTLVAYDSILLGIDVEISRSKVKVNVTINRKSVSSHLKTGHSWESVET